MASKKELRQELYSKINLEAELCSGPEIWISDSDNPEGYAEMSLPSDRHNNVDPEDMAKAESLAILMASAPDMYRLLKRTITDIQDPNHSLVDHDSIVSRIRELLEVIDNTELKK